MNEDSFEDWYNKSAVDIWQRYGKNQQLVPLLLPRIDTNVDVLFLGMNPSHRLECEGFYIETKIQRKGFGFKFLIFKLSDDLKIH